MGVRSAWTPELIEKLRVDYRKVGGRVFAREHGLTPGMVAGMAHRMGLQTRREGVSNVRKRGPLPSMAVTRARVIRPPRGVKIRKQEPPAQPPVLTDRRFRCSWPVSGEGRHTEWCGCPVLLKDGDRRSPYCPEHHKRAHQ